MIPDWLAVGAAAAIIAVVGAWFAIEILRSRHSKAKHDEPEHHGPSGTG